MIQVHAGRHTKTNHRSIQRKSSSSDHCMINVQQKLAKLPKKELKKIIAQTKKLTPSQLAIITKLGQKQINGQPICRNDIIKTLTEMKKNQESRIGELENELKMRQENYQQMIQPVSDPMRESKILAIMAGFFMLRSFIKTDSKLVNIPLELFNLGLPTILKAYL